MKRYVVYAGIMELSVMGESMRQEMWFGLESDDPIALAEFSRETGYMLIPAEFMLADELASIGVAKFDRLEDLEDDTEPS